MNTTTFELPRIATLVPVRSLRQAVPAPQFPVCRDAINCELVLCAKGQGLTAPGRWEQWLFAPVVVASLIGIVTATATAEQWLNQWPALVRWVEQILR